MAITEAGYEFGSTDLAMLLLLKFFPEASGRETSIMVDFLRARGQLYDRYELSVRVGQGQTPDPSALPGVQRALARSSRKRIDMIVWNGKQPTIVEVKERVSPAVLGQLRTYRQLLLEDRPGILEPALLAVGRFSDADTMRVLSAEGIDVITYAEAEPG